MSMTADQRTEALAKANRIRLARSAWKQRTYALSARKSRLKLARTLERGSFRPELRGMTLKHFLLASRGLGITKARAICNHTLIRGLGTELGQLTARERKALAAELRRRASTSAYEK